MFAIQRLKIFKIHLETKKTKHHIMTKSGISLAKNKAAIQHPAAILKPPLRIIMPYC
jgi:hypothetical protein